MHLTGLPCLPLHVPEEEKKREIAWKWKWKLHSCVWLCNPMVCIVHGILQARILEWVVFPFSRRSSQPRDQTQVSCIACRFFTSWAPRKPKNTGVGSLSLVQGIFLTQESNWGLLHCRRILYQLSYEGSPRDSIRGKKKNIKQRRRIKRGWGGNRGGN